MKDIQTRLYHRLNWRIMSWIIVIYLMDSIDRTNLGFARAHISQDVGLTAAQFGFAAGIFFIGLVLFEIPISLLASKVGAPKTFARIMVLWGLTSAATGFIHDRQNFYILRFLLGVFEAGFAPTCTYYLARWYPAERMSGVIFWHQLSLPLAGIMIGPVSGWLLTHFDQVGGLAGWRWMFVMEGLPSVLLGFIIVFVLPSTPQDAKWLSPRERTVIEGWSVRENVRHGTFSAVVRDPAIYMLSLGFFALMAGMYMLNFWMPSLIHEAGVSSPLAVGLYSSFPYAVSVASMAYWSARSDRKKERSFHCYAPALLAAGCFLLTTVIPDVFALQMVVLAGATAGIYASYVVFWALAANVFQGSAATGGFALINAIGLWGGFVSPMVVGKLTSLTGTMSAGMVCMGGTVAVGAAILWSVTRTITGTRAVSEIPAEIL
ncbi:MFS transporter [Komagataeibacter diospyri]|uniref:Major facilitator superfamily transporter n=1 Tax=Komagataeibacter diospyri TaxID=1932662 RepID=A0A4P5NZG3_9PROT|nr:MFS transporter [Komagataeibacter diospyri]GCE85035.1 major facilitator superfamily transporter [Komagataeibacter diospyri]